MSYIYIYINDSIYIYDIRYISDIYLIYQIYLIYEISDILLKFWKTIMLLMNFNDINNLYIVLTYFVNYVTCMLYF